MSTNLEVRLVRDPAELFSVYQTRFEVYIEELGWQSHYANPQTRTLTDDLDRTGNIFAAFRGNEIVGTLRTHHSAQSNLGSYADLYEMRSALRSRPNQLGIATMFMVRKAERGRHVAWQLMAAALEKAIAAGVEQVFIECEFNMVRFYEKCGFTVHRPVIVNPEYGPGVCLSLRLENCPVLKSLPLHVSAAVLRAEPPNVDAAA